LKAKLLVDLTKYHPSLTKDSEGFIIGSFGKLSKEFPKAWVGVKFDHTTLDVLIKHLEYIRPDKQKSDGPVLQIKSDLPPKQNDIVEFNGMQFKIFSIQEKIEDDIWLVNLTALVE
jgi:hypothetical protein